MRIVNLTGDGQTFTFTVGTGGVTKGDLVALSSNTVVAAESAPSDDTIVGIAMETAAAAATASVAVITGSSIVEADYATTGSKTSFTAADVSKYYDLASGSATTIDPDDTTGGFFTCLNYNNDTDKIYGKIKKSVRVY